MSLLDKASLVVTPNAYKESKLYSVVPNTTLGDMDVVRATTATRVNSSGLIEVVPRNLLTYSEQFENANWGKINATVTTNATTAPNGMITADKLIATAVSGIHIALQIGAGAINGQNLTLSVYAKSSGLTRLEFVNNGGGTGIASYNLTTGVATLSSGVSATMQDVGNGWYRCVLTFTPNATGNYNIQIRLLDSSGNSTFTGNATDGIFVWGAQIDNGSTATEYFPTTTRLNIPRIDYTNGSCPSLLVEPQRTNLLTYSNTFSNAAWIKLNCSVASNSIISPDGTQNSTTLTSSVTNTNYLYNAITTANGLYTLSCFVKYLDTNTVNLSMTDFATGEASAKFNFNTGLFNTPIVSGSWTNTTTNVITLTNGWFKISITSQKNAGLSVSSRIDGFAVGKSVYIWGAQLEAASYPTSYIPTVASSVTRNADVISKTGIGSIFGSSYTIYGDFINQNVNTTRLLSLKIPSGGNYDNFITIYQNGTALTATGNNASSAEQFAITSGSFSLNQRLKFALRCQNNNVAFYINGNQIGVDTSCTIPAVTAIYVGNYVDVFGVSVINSVSVFNSALTNTELAQLTTL